MFEPKYWKYCESVTVKQFCDYLKNNVPGDALLFVCGSEHVYIHMEADGSVVSIDNNSLSDLPEYEECEIQELEVKEYG